MEKIGNGNMVLPLKPGKHYRIWGGPYREMPDGMVGVKMAKEIAMFYDVNIPTPDFQTPKVSDLNVGLYQTVQAILTGQPVYVGCMGGKGRTGLMLAVIAKAFDIPNPVEYVRQHYYPHAVETVNQYRFVSEYDIPIEVALAIAEAKGWLNFRAWFRRELTSSPK